MKCSKCKKPFPKDDVGKDCIGLRINLQPPCFPKKVSASFCGPCWMDLWGVTKYLKPVK